MSVRLADVKGEVAQAIQRARWTSRWLERQANAILGARRYLQRTDRTRRDADRRSGADEDHPAWSPDGRTITYHGYRRCSRSPCVRRKGLKNSDLICRRLKVSADILPGRKKRWHFRMAPTGSGSSARDAGKRNKWLKTKLSEISQAFSPDGRWLAFYAGRGPWRDLRSIATNQ